MTDSILFPVILTLLFLLDRYYCDCRVVMPMIGGYYLYLLDVIYSMYKYNEKHLLCFFIGEECLKNGKLSEAEKILTMALNVGKEIYVQNNNFLNIIRDDLAKCYVIQGNSLFFGIFFS